MCLKRLLIRSLRWLPLVIAVGLIFNRCSDKPNKPDNPCQATGDPSGELLTSPVYSPIDTSVYYVDSGAPESYFDDFRNCRASPFTRVVPAGIYRVRLDDDSPAELVLAEANFPRITPDGTTMYCLRGPMGGLEIWRMSLPNGQPELVKAGDFVSASWYAPDTLLVTSLTYGISLLDVRGDSVIDLNIYGHSPDASIDKKICHERGGGFTSSSRERTECCGRTAVAKAWRTRDGLPMGKKSHSRSVVIASMCTSELWILMAGSGNSVRTEKGSPLSPQTAKTFFSSGIRKFKRQWFTTA